MSDDPIAYSVVVPCFNEEGSVRALYTKLCEVMDGLGAPYELIFVDDGSRDLTYKTLSEIYERDSRVHVLQLRKNFGQTAALKAGFDFARGDVVIAMDGDLQYDPADIPALVAKLREGYDIASGWRKDRNDGLTRKWPSFIANWLMARLSRMPLHDFGSTFKAYRREVIQNIPLYGEMHRFIPALASWSGATVVEVPVRLHPRASGESKYGLGRTLRVLMDLVTIKFLIDYSTKPLHFFGLVGLLSALLGGTMSLFLLVDKLMFGRPIMAEHGPLLMVAVVLILGGVQFFSIGLLGDILSRTYYESQAKPVYAVRSVQSRRPFGASQPART
jgi:glycosyltransferase involved in cell wall biosynthesis